MCNRPLLKQTSALGREADDLAKALKGNNKLQGNWGEAVLSPLLATAGLMLLCGAAEGTVLPVLALAGEVLILMGINALLGVIRSREPQETTHSVPGVKAPPALNLRVVRGGKAA